MNFLDLNEITNNETFNIKLKDNTTVHLNLPTVENYMKMIQNNKQNESLIDTLMLILNDNKDKIKFQEKTLKSLNLLEVKKIIEAYIGFVTEILGNPTMPLR
jgi:hypothetical protein